MNWFNNIYYIMVLCALLFVGYVVNLVRKNKLYERYSILWIIFAFIVISGAVFRPLLDYIAKSLQIDYAPSLLFIAGFIFVIFYLLNQTVFICKQNDKIIKLTQEIAIIKEKISNEKQTK